MSISSTISTICTPFMCRNFPHFKPTSEIATRINHCHGGRTLQFQSNTSKTFCKRFAYGGQKLRFSVRAGESNGNEEELEELRGKSTMPDRFRHLTKEVPSPPLRWPWFVALAFSIYAWRSVLWEISNWWKLVLGIGNFFGYLTKLVLALVFRFIGDPISYTILYIETSLHAIRSLYSSIVTSAPIPELTFVIMLASTVLAIGEAASPNSINCQPYLLTTAGIIGYGAVRGFIIEPVFWLLLVGIFSFSRFFKKRDYVSSTLPVATVVASVGEPWVRVLAIISFTVMAIHHHSKKHTDGNKKGEFPSSSGEVPFPLLGVALAIGIRVAAKWAGYRHLTWMIV
ncbi:uncharacterized protein LOC130816489 [Amaranthus tricolor]|uniref:uncharacterized protein LOC130816489 n=1 Tax=Amaranthus tricolor TaxID=29722 RepID=UPI00258DA305|nr:uncharacterized protein LOC130816489 [Amaranthus tricolor]